MSTDPGTDSLGWCAGWVGWFIGANGNGRSTWGYAVLAFISGQAQLHFDLGAMIGAVGGTSSLVTGRSTIMSSVSPRPCARFGLWSPRGIRAGSGGRGRSVQDILPCVVLRSPTPPTIDTSSSGTRRDQKSSSTAEFEIDTMTSVTGVN